VVNGYYSVSQICLIEPQYSESTVLIQDFCCHVLNVQECSTLILQLDCASDDVR